MSNSPQRAPWSGAAPRAMARSTSAASATGGSSSPRGLDRARGLARRALSFFTTPLLPADYGGLFNPLVGREMRGRIESIAYHEDLISLELQPAAGIILDFQPGQFIGFGIQIEGRWKWRCFSITSTPTQHKNLVSLTIKQVPDGAVSTHLATKAAAGDIIRLTQPGGDFYLSHPIPRKIFFLTAGSGITPVMAMLRWLKQECSGAAAEDLSIVHIHSERGGHAPAPFATELADLGSSLPGYELTVWCSTERGRISPDALEKLVPDVASRERFACGPGPLLEAMTQHFPGTRVESFSTGSDAASAAGGTISFPGMHTQAECDSSTSILEAAEAHGVELTHGCRMGICHTCTAEILDGQAVDARTGQTHREGERVRTCCSIPDGPISIQQS